MGFIGRTIYLVLLVVYALATSSLAESISPFNEYKVRDIFSSRHAKEHKGAEFSYFPSLKRVSAKKAEKAEEEFTVAEETQSEEISENKEKLPIDDKKVLDSPDAVVKNYGDPSIDFPVLAKKDSPLPFQGMMQALQIGDQMLAFQYAKQYVRYMRDLQDRSTTITGIVGKAMEREGLADGEGWTGADNYKQYNKLLEKDMEGSKQEQFPELANVDKETKELIKLAEEAERQKLEQDKKAAVATIVKDNEASLSDSQKRAALRAKISGKVPVDPQGKVDVYFFFRPNDKNSIVMGPVIEQIYQRSLSDTNLNFIGFTFENEGPDSIAYFHQKSSSSFPVQNGQLLADSMSLKVSPTLIFIAQSSGRSVAQSGPKSFLFIDELLNIMQGKGLVK